MRFIHSNITSSCTYGSREEKKKEKEKRKGSLSEDQECSMESDYGGHFLASQVLLVFPLYQCLVWMKWPGNTAHLNAIFPATQPSETMSNANWTEQHWNTLRLTLQDSFPPYVNYAQREYCANHKPGKACKNMCPSLQLQLLKPKGLTFAVQTLGSGGEWGPGDVKMAGEQGREWAHAGWFWSLQLQFSSQGWLFSHLNLCLQFSHAFFFVKKGPYSECSHYTPKVCLSDFWRSLEGAS